MVVQVVEWEWIFGVIVWLVMRKVGLRSTNGETSVVVEVDGMDNIDIDIEDSEGNIEDMVDFFCKALANLVAKIGFEFEMANVAKERVCFN